jgi:hypothetical protein
MHSKDCYWYLVCQIKFTLSCIVLVNRQYDNIHIYIHNLSSYFTTCHQGGTTKPAQNKSNHTHHLVAIADFHRARAQNTEALLITGKEVALQVHTDKTTQLFPELTHTWQLKCFRNTVLQTWPPLQAFVHIMGQLFHTRCGGCSWEREVPRDHPKMTSLWEVGKG